MGVAVRRDRSPVVEVVGELPVPTREEVGLEVDTGEAVVSPGALAPADLGLGNSQRAFRNVIHDAHALRDPGADVRAGAVHAVIVIDLDPIVILDAQIRRVPLADPDRLAAPGEGQHPDNDWVEVYN